MVADYLLSTSNFGARTCFVEHVSQWPFSYYERYWHCYSKNIREHADDNALYKACYNVDADAEILRVPTEKLFKW